MSEIEREKCPRCGEPAALAGRICPHCKGSLLVDVVVDAAPADARERYQLARAIGALGPPAPAFLAAQQALAIPGSVLVTSVSRDLARQLLQLLETHGGRGKAIPETTTAGPAAVEAGGGGGRGLWAGAAVLVLVAVGWGLLADRRGAESGGQPGQRAAAAAAGTGAAAPLSTRELAARVTPSTVVLRCAGSVGTGFFVAPDLVLTNAHVLCPGGGAIRAVFADGREFTGSAVESDAWLDMALVRVPDTGAAPLPLGDATVLRTGDEVVFVGSPKGLEFTVHEGIVSHTGRNLLGVAYLQIDANVNSGNSGGPLFDQAGRVVGIVTAKLDQAEGLGFVLPINYAYEGRDPYLPRPAPAPDAESWRGLLAQVEEADRRDAERMEEAASHSALLGVSPIPGRGLAAQVVRFSHVEPGPEPISFTFRKAERSVCSVSATVGQWQQVEPETGGEAARYLQWMEKHGIYKDLYHGVAMVDLEGCPAGEIAGTEIELDTPDSAE